jgi:hypothetical protein
VSDVIVCRLKYRVPAAAPEPLCRRQRAYRGFRSLCRRFMRAILDAARIPIRRERDSACRAICADAVVPAGADGRRRRQTIAVRQLNLFGLVSAARRLFSFGNPRFQFRQEPARRVADPFHCTNSFVAHVEQPTEGPSACLTNGGANPPANGASR